MTKYAKVLIHGHPNDGKTTILSTALEDERMTPALYIHCAGNPEVANFTHIVTIKTVEDVQEVFSYFNQDQPPKHSLVKKLGEHVVFKSLLVDNLTMMQKLVMNQILTFQNQEKKISMSQEPNLASLRTMSQQGYGITANQTVMQAHLLYQLADDKDIHVIMTGWREDRSDFNDRACIMLDGKSKAQVPGLASFIIATFDGSSLGSPLREKAEAYLKLSTIDNLYLVTTKGNRLVEARQPNYARLPEWVVDFKLGMYLDVLNKEEQL